MKLVCILILVALMWIWPFAKIHRNVYSPPPNPWILCMSIFLNYNIIILKPNPGSTTICDCHHMMAHCLLGLSSAVNIIPLSSWHADSPLSCHYIQCITHPLAPALRPPQPMPPAPLGSFSTFPACHTISALACLQPFSHTVSRENVKKIHTCSVHSLEKNLSLHQQHQALSGLRVFDSLFLEASSSSHSPPCRIDKLLVICLISTQTSFLS